MPCSATGQPAIATVAHVLSPPDDLFVKAGYRTNPTPDYYADVDPDGDIVYQPDVYPLAAHLARRCGARVIIDIGCGTGHKLAALAGEFHTVGFDYGDNIAACRAAYPGGNWEEVDLDQAVIVLPAELLEHAVVVCSDVIEHLASPANLLWTLRTCSEQSHGVVISTPERDLVRGPDDMGPPANVAHVREWNSHEFDCLLRWAGMTPTLLGLTANNSVALAKRTIVATVHGGTRAAPDQPAPDAFDVLAVVTCFNESDIIVDTVADLLAQGCSVHVVDNWSTDGSLEAVRERFGDGVTTERHPIEGPSATYDWGALLERVDEFAASTSADWIVHHDADERRRSPWPGVSLRDAIWFVHRSGWTAIDFTVVNFVPVDESWRAGAELESAFMHWEFGRNPGHASQVKAWRNPRVPVGLAEHGGHDIDFAERRVYPYNFLLKHYPIRSTEQGRRKIDRDRRQRWNADERAAGWHTQYDAVDTDAALCRSPEDTIVWTDRTRIEMLTEFVARVGIEGFPSA